MIEHLPGFSPITFHGDLTRYDHIVLSVSGGKDSHAMLFYVLQLAEKQHVRDRLKVVYADTGMEWHNAEAHVKRLCEAANVPLSVVYPVRPMLEKFILHFQRIKGRIHTAGFPNPQCRYCTSNQKCDPMDKYIRTLSGRILQVTGERRDESRNRAKLPDYGVIDRLCTKNRTVEGWRPMLEFETADVWAVVKESGIQRHVCYDLGCSRLGCAGCIFSRDWELAIEMRENPAIFEALDRLEVDSGYTMSMSGKRIRDRISHA